MHCSNFMRNVPSLIIATMSNGSEQLVAKEEQERSGSDTLKGPQLEYDYEIAEDEQETIRSENLKDPQLEFDCEIAQISPLHHVGVETDHPSLKKAIRTGKEEEEEEACGTASFRQEHKPVEEDGENNDGFRTPTSPDHKIPEITECPPAPMRPKPTRKRKLSLPTFSDDRCREVIDLNSSEEVESLFQPICHGEIKKSRRDGNNN